MNSYFNSNKGSSEQYKLKYLQYLYKEALKDQETQRYTSRLTYEEFIKSIGGIDKKTHIE